MPRLPPSDARSYALSDFDFSLPTELIAQQPTAERSASRLLDGTGLTPIDRVFRDLPDLLSPSDLVVFNDTRVIKARLFGEKATGGAVEVLVERLLQNNEVLVQLRASKSPRAGTWLRLAQAFDVEVLGRTGADESLFHLRFPSEPLALLDAHGHVPLPPYIARADAQADEQRYQTIFAERPGAVAAPTASLHIDAAWLAALEARGVQRAQVTLHVGAGTFQPVRVENLADHRMHSDWFDVPLATVAAIARTRERGGQVVAVGTTALRALESAARATPAGLPLAPCSGDTDLFITPGYPFQVVDRLVTNFHLPRSTLLMLVSAFAGFEHVRALYRHAIESRYRFYSYGDAMCLQRR